jgi:nucleotide-binding universal stress UspA family protein
MQTTIKKILIPTDFSELSKSAIKVGIAIAKRQKAEVIILHILDITSSIQVAEVIVPDSFIRKDIKETVIEGMNELIEKIYQDTGIKAKSEILEGSPAESICKYSYKENVNLIVMGTHGVSGIREFLIGSEAYKVVKYANCPVLTIPGNWKKTTFNKVLFPLRLQPGFMEKYYFARPIIERNNAELILLGLSEKNNTDQLSEITAIMENLKYQLNNDNIIYTSAVCPCNDFPEKVISASIIYKTDLMIITANLNLNIKSFFIGSYAKRVINHAKVPVLSVKPQSEVGQIQPEKNKFSFGNNIYF